MMRLGQGTDESHDRLQHAVDEIMGYSEELVIASEADNAMLDAGIGVNLETLKLERDKEVKEILDACELKVTDNLFHHTGGKTGIHTEHLGYILTDMQYLQRAYPGNEW